MKPYFIPEPCPVCHHPRKVINGAWLREQRERTGRSLRSVAARVGISAAYLSDLERGHRAVSLDISNRVMSVLTEVEP